MCVGRISLADGPLREWLDGFPQKNAEVLELIGLDPQGGFARAAFVSPIGLHDLRAQEAPGRYVVRFGASRALAIRF